MLRRLGMHLTNQWMGALALFLVLGGGAAYATGTIGSADIIDESVRSVDLLNNTIHSADIRDDTAGGGLRAADLGPRSVGVSELDPGAFAGPDITQDSPTSPFEIANDAVQTSEVLDGTLVGADIASSSLTGADVAPESLTGSDISEATLGGFDGHDAYRDHCDTPSDNTFRECLSVTFELGRPMEVLVMYGGGGGHGSNNGDIAYGECRTRLDGADKLEPVNLWNPRATPVGMAAIFDVMSLSAGTHTVALACREDPTDMEFYDLTIGVVELAFD